jgi:hypothetical protein
VRIEKKIFRGWRKMNVEETKMNYKLILCIVLPISIMVFGINLNFYEFLIGSPATFKNFIVTFVYLVFWIMCLLIASKTENRAVIRFYTIIWILTLGVAGLTASIHFTDTTVSFAWAIPFAALLLTPWVGLNYLVDSYIVSSIIIMIISLTMFSALNSIIRSWKKVL